MLGAVVCLLAPSASGGQELSPRLLSVIAKKWTGDFDEMVKRRVIRVLVVYSKTFYFLDKGTERGITYDALKLFEDDINKQPAVKKQLAVKHLRVNVVFLPVHRGELIPALLEGRGDLAAAFLTVTPERQKLVDFSDPILGGVDEIVISGPGAPPIADREDLSGKAVFVRKSSSYYESLQALTVEFAKAGKAPVQVKPAPEELEDEDLLEMVNAGLVPLTVVDSQKAQFWKQIYPKVVLHPNVAVRTGGEIAWMVRKDSPQLKAAVNDFIRRRGRGGSEAQILVAEYLKNTKWVKNSTSEAEMEKFQRTVEFFKKYGETYDIDYLLLMAQGYQESTLDQNAKSAVGAIGIMQLMPATGAAMGVGNIADVEPNIHAGAKYIRFMVDQYFKDEPMNSLNKALFAFASYNAGPNRIAQLRREATQQGFDSNVWFNNVEIVAAKRIGRQTPQYVSNIYKYYIAYTLITEAQEERAKAIRSIKGS
jgi:membrane-bound lytic murein transglycosylase MltF